MTNHFDEHSAPEASPSTKVFASDDGSIPIPSTRFLRRMRRRQRLEEIDKANENWFTSVSRNDNLNQSQAPYASFQQTYPPTARARRQSCVQLFVRTFTGISVTLDVPLDMSTLDLKMMIERRLPIPIRLQSLVYRSRIMANPCTLGQIGVSNNSTINLAIVGGIAGGSETEEDDFEAPVPQLQPDDSDKLYIPNRVFRLLRTSTGHDVKGSDKMSMLDVAKSECTQFCLQKVQSLKRKAAEAAGDKKESGVKFHDWPTVNGVKAVVWGFAVPKRMDPEYLKCVGLTASPTLYHGIFYEITAGNTPAQTHTTVVAVAGEHGHDCLKHFTDYSFPLQCAMRLLSHAPKDISKLTISTLRTSEKRDITKTAAEREDSIYELNDTFAMTNTLVTGLKGTFRKVADEDDAAVKDTLKILSGLGIKGLEVAAGGGAIKLHGGPAWLTNDEGAKIAEAIARMSLLGSSDNVFPFMHFFPCNSWQVKQRLDDSLAEFLKKSLGDSAHAHSVGFAADVNFSGVRISDTKNGQDGVWLYNRKRKGGRNFAPPIQVGFVALVSDLKSYGCNEESKITFNLARNPPMKHTVFEATECFAMYAGNIYTRIARMWYQAAPKLIERVQKDIKIMMEKWESEHSSLQSLIDKCSKWDLTKALQKDREELAYNRTLVQEFFRLKVDGEPTPIMTLLGDQTLYGQVELFDVAIQLQESDGSTTLYLLHVKQGIDADALRIVCYQAQAGTAKLHTIMNDEDACQMFTDGGDGKSWGHNRGLKKQTEFCSVTAEVNPAKLLVDALRTATKVVVVIALANNRVEKPDQSKRFIFRTNSKNGKEALLLGQDVHVSALVLHQCSSSIRHHLTRIGINRIEIAGIEIPMIPKKK